MRKVVLPHQLSTAVVLFSLLAVNAQQPTVLHSSQLLSQPAFQELTSVITEAQNLQNKTDVFKVLSKSANLLWLQSPTKSRSMFQELWQLSKAQEGASSNGEEALTETIRYLAQRDSNLAAKLLEDASGGVNTREAPFSKQVKGSDPTSQRLTHLSSKLVQQDSTQAAAVLERVLSVSVTPAALLFMAVDFDVAITDLASVRTI